MTHLRKMMLEELQHRNFSAIGVSLVQRVSAPIDARLLGNGHENWILLRMALRLRIHFDIGLLSEKKETCENAHIGFDDEGFHGNLDARQDPTVAKNPTADIFVARVPKDAVGQNNTHAPPPDAAI